MSQFPKTLGCGTVIQTEAKWNTLADRKIGVMGDVLVEQRLCPCGCGSHVMIELPSCGVPEDEDDITDEAA